MDPSAAASDVARNLSAEDRRRTPVSHREMEIYAEHEQDPYEMSGGRPAAVSGMSRRDDGDSSDSGEAFHSRLDERGAVRSVTGYSSGVVDVRDEVGAGDAREVRAGSGDEDGEEEPAVKSIRDVVNQRLKVRAASIVLLCELRDDECVL